MRNILRIRKNERKIKIRSKEIRKEGKTKGRKNHTKEEKVWPTLCLRQEMERKIKRRKNNVESQAASGSETEPKPPTAGKTFICTGPEPPVCTGRRPGTAWPVLSGPPVLPPGTKCFFSFLLFHFLDFN